MGSHGSCSRDVSRVGLMLDQTSLVAGHEWVSVDAGDSVPLRSAAQVIVRMRADGVVVVTLPAGDVITEDHALQTRNDLLHLTGGNTVPVLLNLTGVCSISREARSIYSNATTVAAYALLGETPVDRVIAHFLLGTEPPSCPSHFFTSEADALAWLKGPRDGG